VNKHAVHFTAHITSSSFNNNYAHNGSGIYISTTHSASISLIIERCILYNNVGEFGSGIYLLDRSSSDEYLFIPSDVSPHNCVVVSNTTFLKNIGVSLVAKYYCAVIYMNQAMDRLNQAMDVMIIDTTFIENNCTCISINERSHPCYTL